MTAVCKLFNINLQSYCNGTKTSPVDAESNSLSNHMSCIDKIDFSIWKKKRKLFSCLHSILMKAV